MPVAGCAARGNCHGSCGFGFSHTAPAEKGSKNWRGRVGETTLLKLSQTHPTMGSQRAVLLAHSRPEQHKSGRYQEGRVLTKFLSF